MPVIIDPVAVSIGGLSIRWYGLIIAFGALVGLLMAIREGRRFGLSSDFFLDLILFGTPAAIIGARLYYVAFQWDYYRERPGEIFQIWEGGIAIYGALIGAILVGIWYARKKKVSFLRIADICAPSLIIGQMIGRWGNFTNQEAHGGPVTEAYLRETLRLPGFIVDQMYIDGQYYHPTFLYESVWNLLVLLLLLVLRRWKPLRVGELFWTYLMVYSLGRFFIEGMRTDSLAFRGPDWLASLVDGLWTPMRLMLGEPGYLDPAYGNIRASQLLALALVAAMIATIAIRRIILPNAPRYGDPLLPAGAGSDSGEAVPAGAESAGVAADEPLAGGPKSDEAKAVELLADGPRTDEAKADEPQADGSKPDEAEADEPKSVEPQADDTDGGRTPDGGDGKEDSRT